MSDYPNRAMLFWIELRTTSRQANWRDRRPDAALRSEDLFMAGRLDPRLDDH